MQLNAITRKSALMAILLLVAILVAAAVRYTLAPNVVELANSPFRERTISLVLAMFLFFGGGFLAGKMLPRSGLSKGYCALPIPLYGVLACGIFLPPNTLAAASAALLLAWSLYLLSRSLHNAGEKDSVFFASIMLGAMVLIYPPCVVFVAVIPLAIFILALSLRQAILMIVGYLMPLFATSYVMWYRGGEFWDLTRNIFDALGTQQMGEITAFPYLATAMVVVVVALLLWGTVYAVARPDKMFSLTRVRRSLHLFVWLFAVSLSMLFIPSVDLSAIALVAVPTTILLSFVLSLLPNNQSTIAYWVLLLLFVVHLVVM